MTDHRPYDPLIDTLGSLSITAWWPVRVVVLALGAVAVLAAARALRRPASPVVRTLAVTAAVLLALLTIGGVVNAHYAYVPTLGEALGDEPSLSSVDGPDGVTAGSRRTGQVGAAHRPAHRVRASRRARPRSTCRLRGSRRGGPRCPWSCSCTVSPVTRPDWADGGEAAATADAWAAQHRGVAPVLVMPDINGSLTADTECVDSPVGNAETYLTVDVPAAVQQRFGTTPPGRSWALAGLSEGGACAIMLALRHPDLFGTFGDFGGLSGPRVGESDDDTAATVAELFGGSRQEFAAHEPADLLATQPAFRDRRVVRGRRRRRRAARRRPAAGPARRRGGHLHLPGRRPGRRAHLRRLERRLPPVTAVDGGSGSGWCRLPRRRPRAARPDARVHRSVDTQVNRHTGRSADCAGAARAASSWVSGNEPGRPDGETEMTTMSTPYATTAPSYSTSDDDTVRLPLVTDPRPAEYRALDTRPADHRPVLDATRLWTGGLATAAVAALVALVGTLVIRVLVAYAPVGRVHPHAIAGATPACSACSPPSPRWPPPASPTC